MMKKSLFFAGVVFLMLLAAYPLMAEEPAKENPWETFSLNAGAFLSTSKTDLRFGSGVGVSVNLEDSLGMDTETGVFRLESLWRFTDSRRHRVDLSWFSYNRNGVRNIDEDIIIEKPDGEKITIPAGAKVKSFFELDIYQAAYSYSFLQNDSLDIAAQFGLYIMPINLGLSVTGVVDEEADQKFTAPLPVIGVRMDVLIAPKWYYRSGFQFFYVQYENFTGSLLNLRNAVEYNPWKHVGFGVGIDALRMGLEAEGSGDYPGVDLRGNVNFEYTGIMLYGKVFF